MCISLDDVKVSLQLKKNTFGVQAKIYYFLALSVKQGLGGLVQ